MNAERLHALADKIAAEIAETAALENLASVVTALQAVVTQSNANTQQQLASALEEFRTGLAATSLPRWSPAWRELLSEVGADPLLGENLLDSVNTIIASNAITPSVARKEIDTIHENLAELSAAVENLQSGFGTLRIEAEELEPGECEVGFLIPRRAVDNELGAYAKELKELDFILRTLSEVATGSVEPVQIRTVSSSDFLVLLAQHSGQAALLAVVLERLMGAYKTILSIRKLHGELSQLVGSKPLKEVEKQAESIMLKEINATADQVIKNYPAKDEGRKHELRTALDTVLRKLADRIDRGFNVEIRIAALPPANDPAAAKLDAKEVKQHDEHRAIIERAAKQLEFAYRGGSPILHLDRPGASDEPEQGAKPKRASRKSKVDAAVQ